MLEIAAHIRAAMQAKHPATDLEPYFAFLTACPAQPVGETHSHHIAPKEQFPQYRRDRANLITLTVDDHKEAHRILNIAAPDCLYFRGMEAARRGGQVPKSPSWRVANAAANAANKGRAYKQLALPEKRIVAWYRAGLGLTDIARKLGTDERPNGSGARTGRIRRALIRAGVYKKVW